ncbi:DUF1214 domain-containing protein [Ilumatobacter sp.]|uniref:DUF1214 domain-containing protein n=1 Tax=Ilumatobacter sp. TaxID=1967498 RepID=UPI003C6AEAE8
MGEAHAQNLSGQDTIEHFISEYPNRQQVTMMTAWLAEHAPASFSFTGLVDPSDSTVITPQATVDYGYSWFSLSDGPAIVRTPSYARFFSVSVFDMRHNVPAVIANPTRPILLIRPGQEVPDGDHEIVELETDQGLVLTRMVVVDNMAEVRRLSASITMDGGDGDMHRTVQRFSPGVAEAASAVIASSVPHLNPDIAFGRKSGDVGDLTLAGAVMLGQLGTPADTVRYGLILADENGQPFNGEDTYVVTVPAGIVRDGGYFSVTVYGSDNKLLIENDLGVYDRTSYSATAEADGSYTITLGPSGDGTNGIPTGKPFYGILRAYLPVPGADLTAAVHTV